MRIVAVDNSTNELRWGPEQRFEFIEFKLFWEGKINRNDLIDQFGVSVPQASKDLAAYRDIAPDNLHYDAKVKRYLVSENFNPILFQPNPDRYLSQLKAMAEHIMRIEDTWMSAPPPADAMPIPTRKVNAFVLRAVVEAIQNKKSICVFYHSMNDQRPDAIWRLISPHAFAYDGFRWHVRAYCHMSEKFKDFLLSRCQDAQSPEPTLVSAVEDMDWNRYFGIILRPNPLLSENQQAAVAWDYNMADGQVTVLVRYALLYYFNKRLRLDVAEQHDRPHERPIVVVNELEFKRALQSLAN
jgi:predicted DNA-binding transcriptional regulator YafY